MFTQVFQSTHEISSGASNIKLPFPIKLHHMLEEMAMVGDDSIVSWQPHGKAFRVHQSDAFVNTVMPRYFKQQTKYKSFQRQLHLYGFHRIKRGKDEGAYFHSMFTRNDKSMSLQMSYKKVKTKKSRQGAVDRRDVACDPDFYSTDTYVDNTDQQQEIYNLANTLQSVDPRLYAFTTSEGNKRGCRRSIPATVFSTTGIGDDHQQPDEEEKPTLRKHTGGGSSDDPQQSDEEKPLPSNSAVLLNQEVPGGPSLVSSEIWLVDWMQHAKKIISRDTKLPSSGYKYGDTFSASEKDHELSLFLREEDHQEYCDEGFFEGKRFFHVSM